MELRKAERKQAKMKMAIAGPSGSGKTYSALLLARGITTWDKIAVIDTENNSADLYAELGYYSVLPLKESKPENCIKAIDICINAGMEVIIFDSITHEWDWVKDYHDKLPGNSFTNWAKVMPAHNKFIQKILAAPVHIISTMRTKQDYVLQDKNGKKVPEKIGLRAVQREGIDYEFTLVFDIDMTHHVLVSKDRTNLFKDKQRFVIDETTGQAILEWCQRGTSEQEVRDMIENAKKVPELNAIWNNYPEFQLNLKQAFSKKRKLIEQAASESKAEPKAA